MPHPLPAGLQAQRLVALVRLQRLMWQRPEDPVQVAQGESLQRRTAVSPAGPEEPGATSGRPPLHVEHHPVPVITLECGRCRACCSKKWK